MADDLLGRHDPGLAGDSLGVSVVYVSALSLWALVSGHWSAWQAARVEVNQQAEAKRRRSEDVAGEVVQRLVEETNVEASG